jgi:hypothetical protein
MYVADSDNFVIRKIAADGTVSTLAGQPGVQGVQLGPLPGALSPRGLALADDKTLYVTSGNAVLRIGLR